MNKLILLLMLAMPASAGQITDAQAVQVSTTAFVLQDAAYKMMTLGFQTHLAFNNNGYAIQGSTNTYALTTQQKTDLSANYQALKTQMQNVFATLP